MLPLITSLRPRTIVTVSVDPECGINFINICLDISQMGSSTKYAATISPWILYVPTLRARYRRYSPDISTHYDYKNFYQRGDDWLIVSRWEQLIEMRDQLPMVEMVTW